VPRCRPPELVQTETTSRVPPRWFVHAAWRVHRALHRLSGGRFLWTTSNRRGWGALHLTTTGRRSGRERGVIVGFLEDGSSYVTLAMNGWQEGPPAWWLNLEAHPEAVVRVADGVPQRVRARRAEGAERERLWQRWREADPKLLAPASSRATVTPVVVFEPLTG
jgi:deazaflavin-dependent oxidoreductase (nitroreductase family)